MTAPSTSPVFVLGTGRCGSTLVHEVLCQHPDVRFVNNLQNRFTALERFTAGGGQVYRRMPPAFTKKGRVRFAPSEAYDLLDRRVAPMFSRSLRDLTATDATPYLAGRMRATFDLAAPDGAGTVVHKFTGWPRARFLDAVFPGARFLHVIRDGRAVANSWLQMPWWLGYQGPEHWQWGPLPPRYRREWEGHDRSFVALAGIAWKLLLDQHDECRAAVGADRWLDVRYEDVVEDPIGTFDRARRHIGLAEDSRFDRRLRTYSFERSRTDAFRDDLGRRDVAILEDVLGERLAQLGYESRAGAA